MLTAPIKMNSDGQELHKNVDRSLNEKCALLLRPAAQAGVFDTLGHGNA
jgi:hypothetical protein